MNECDQETEQRSGYGDMQVGITMIVVNDFVSFSEYMA